MLAEFEAQVKSAGIVDGIPPQKAKPETAFNAGELMTMNLPEPKWAVPDILPEGLNILAGKPKMGKSVLSLNIAIAIASGGKALSKIDVERGAVLYLALEDTKRRLQSRIKAMLQSRPAPENLFFETVWPKIDDDGLVKLDRKIQGITNLRLLIIDTLKKIKPIENGRNRNPYDIDYENVSAIKTLADKFNLCILLIHHLRKTESEDVMDDFSGTFGLTGAADGLLALKRKTGQSDAELHLIGRDVDAAEYALKYHPDIWTWELLGDAQEVKKTRNLQATYNAIKQSEKALKPKEIAEISDVKYRTVTANLKSLMRDGSIQKTTYGEYKI
jgi:RecA-family ATPase